MEIPEEEIGMRKIYGTENAETRKRGEIIQRKYKVQDKIQGVKTMLEQNKKKDGKQQSIKHLEEIERGESRQRYI